MWLSQLGVKPLLFWPVCVYFDILTCERSRVQQSSWMSSVQMEKNPSGLEFRILLKG